MARIIQLENGSQFSAAIEYFSAQLPAKEVGWFEFFGDVYAVQTSVGSLGTVQNPLQVVSGICYISATSHSISATLSDSNGQIVYAGSIQDFASASLQGRFSTLPRNPWIPEVKQESLTARVDQSTKTTVELTAASEMSWTELAAIRPEDISVSPPTVAPVPHVPKTVDDLKLGDILLHPRFGRCKVVRAPAFGKIKIRRPSGSFTDLHLKVIKPVKIEEVDGERIVHIKIVASSVKD